MSFLRSAPGAEPVVVEGIFRAPVERVFHAWTDPETVKRWFGRLPGPLVAAEIDLRVGGTWRFTVSRSAEKTVRLEGEYLTIDHDRQLVFTWRHVTEHADGQREATSDSRVSVMFEPHGRAARVTLRHEAIAREEARLGVGQGWQTSFERMQALMNESGSGEAR